MGESGSEPQDGGADTPRSAPRQLSIDVEDFRSFDVNAVVGTERAATYYQLHTFYASEIGVEDESARSRAAFTVASLLSMFMRDEDPNNPFGPMFVFNTGRSANISDFRHHQDVVRFLADNARHPLIKARCADIYWLFRRSEREYAQMAISGYLEAVDRVGNSSVDLDFAADQGRLHPDVKKYVARALQVANGLRKQKPDISALHAICKSLFKEALVRGEAHAVLAYGKLCLQYDVFNPGELARAIEKFVSGKCDTSDSHLRVEAWRLAASCHHHARDETERYRCQSEAAEELARHALEGASSAMVSASFLMDAVRQLQGIPGKRERRAQLKEKLLQVQSSVGEEMSTFSHEIDLREVIEDTNGKFSDHSLFDQLMAFAVLDLSPDPDELNAKAKEMIRGHPLSSLFPAVILDREGKVIEKAEGGISVGEISDSATSHQIEQTDHLRRHLIVSGMIEPARRVIAASHIVEGEKLTHLFKLAFFVPPDLVYTFSQGVARFFQGDFTSALYILVPLLEASVKHVLKQSGVDVSNFDDATVTQEDKNIGSLFSSMRSDIEKTFTASIAANIERVFLLKFGPHIRHSVAHGLLSDGDPFRSDAIYACYLIIHLSLMPLYKHKKEIKEMVGSYLDF